MAALTDTLMRDYWHLVAHRSELAAPGDFVRLEWGLGDLVLHNDEGEVIAFDNVCPHRGGRFFMHDRGSARAVCPYHGWSVRRGEVRVTRPAEFSACDLGRARLTGYSTVWCGDWLFVGVSPIMTLDAQLQAFSADLQAISAEVAALCGLQRIDWRSNWRVAVENALEGYHVNSVHPETLATLALYDHEDRFTGLNSAYFGRIGDPRTLRGLKGLNRFFDLRAQFDGYCSYYVFPFAMVSSTFGYSYALQNFMPRQDAATSWFYSRLFSSRVAQGGEGVAETLMEATRGINRRIFEEDHEICSRVSPAYDLDAPHRIYAKSEARLRVLADHLQEIEAGQAAAERSLQRAYMAR